MALDIGLLAVFLVGFLARHIHPESLWWPQLVAIGLPYLALGVVAATGIVAIARAWKLLVVHGLVLVLLVARFVPFASPASEPGDALALLSFNIGHLEPFTTGQAQDVLLEVTDRFSADLYVFQDLLIRYRRREQRIVNYPELEARLNAVGVVPHAEALPRIETTFQPVWARRSRVQLLEEKRIKLATDDSVSMGVTRVRFRWQGREAVLYNVHLRTFGERKPWSDPARNLASPAFWASYLRQYREAFIQRARESESIRKLMDEETLPLVIAGDFNSTVHTWSYHHLARGMQDAFVEAGKGHGLTYHARYPVVRIDHVLVSPHWEVYRAEVTPAPYSDHRPLQVTLGWRSESSH